MNRHSVYATLLICFGACGGDNSEETTSSVEGIYAITTWTENEMGCESEGASILASEEATHFIVSSSEVLGFGSLLFNPYQCADLEECERKFLDGDNLVGGQQFFDSDGTYESSGASY